MGILKMVWPNIHNHTANLKAKPRLESSWIEVLYVELSSTTLSYRFSDQLSSYE